MGNSTSVSLSPVASSPIAPSPIVNHSAESRDFGSSLVDGFESQTTSLVMPVSPSITATQNTHHMVTRGKASIYKLKAYTAIVSAIEPSNIHEGMNSPRWGAVVHDELATLVNNNTCELVTPPPD